jgi:DNA-directed RNA polymerase specialized sigma24 family protein
VPVLTPNAFELLLARLDADSTQAADKYEELRLKLTKFFAWRGCPESNADNLADETLDRVAAKLAQGVEIHSLRAYTCETARYVWLEYGRKSKEDTFGDDTPEIAVEPDLPEDPDWRIACLRSCLVEISNSDTDRALILGYYDTENVEKIKDQRKSLAEKLGLTANTLKVKASRLRDRLEKCINECVRKRTSPVTE